jgi:hypothetical protein
MHGNDRSHTHHPRVHGEETTNELDQHSCCLDFNLRAHSEESTYGRVRSASVPLGLQSASVNTTRRGLAPVLVQITEHPGRLSNHPHPWRARWAATGFCSHRLTRGWTKRAAYPLMALSQAWEESQAARYDVTDGNWARQKCPSCWPSGGAISRVPQESLELLGAEFVAPACERWSVLLGAQEGILRQATNSSYVSQLRNLSWNEFLHKEPSTTVRCHCLAGWIWKKI